MACCPAPAVNDGAYNVCVRGAWPEFSHFGFTFHRSDMHRVNSWLSWDEIREQISKRNSPIAFSWKYVGGGNVKGHMMVITGYETIATGNFLLIADPLPENKGTSRQIRYEVYVEQPGDHTHWWDYYDIALNPD